jgi:hypothetical protein
MAAPDAAARGPESGSGEGANGCAEAFEASSAALETSFALPSAVTPRWGEG